jgi:hypothetical protein
VLQIKSGTQTKRQCVRCYLSSDLLSAVESRAQLRTVAAQQAFRQRMLDSKSPQDAEDLSRRCGTHADASGMWGFAGESEEACECAASGACVANCNMRSLCMLQPPETQLLPTTDCIRIPHTRGMHRFLVFGREVST